LLWGFAASAQNPAVPAPMTFEAALDRALQANPAILAARLRGATSRAAVDVARERLNPEFLAEFERETPTRAYGISLPWEAGGKREHRIAAGEAAVKTSDAELAQAIIEVRTSVRRAYFSRVIAEARVTLVDELQALAVRARDAAQQRFDAGSIPRLELLQAQLGLAQAENDATTARGALRATRAELNALLALPLDAPTPLAASLDPAILPSPAAVDTLAQSTSVELAVLDNQLEEQRARIALARALQVPDVTSAFMITRGAEPEFSTGWRAAVAVAVPLFTRHRAGVHVEEAALVQLSSAREAVVARIRGEVASAVARAEAQRQQYLRYRDQILPAALEVERLAEDAYRFGQTGIAAFLQALQVTRETRLRALQAAADYQAAVADLEQAVGAPLS
jgi:cobalt-zinc-cadmium efflux system outer membrane protein